MVEASLFYIACFMLPRVAKQDCFNIGVGGQGQVYN